MSFCRRTAIIVVFLLGAAVVREPLNAQVRAPGPPAFTRTNASWKDLWRVHRRDIGTWGRNGQCPVAIESPESLVVIPDTVMTVRNLPFVGVVVSIDPNDAARGMRITDTLIYSVREVQCLLDVNENNAVYVHLVVESARDALSTRLVLRDGVFDDRNSHQHRIGYKTAADVLRELQDNIESTSSGLFVRTSGGLSPAFLMFDPVGPGQQGVCLSGIGTNSIWSFRVPRPQGYDYFCGGGPAIGRLRIVPLRTVVDSIRIRAQVEHDSVTREHEVRDSVLARRQQERDSVTRATALARQPQAERERANSESAFRRRMLLSRGWPASVVDAVLSHTLVEGMTKQQVNEAMGRPGIPLSSARRRLRGVLVETYDYYGRCQVTYGNSLATGWTGTGCGSPSPN